MKTRSFPKISAKGELEQFSSDSLPAIHLMSGDVFSRLDFGAAELIAGVRIGIFVSVFVSDRFLPVLTAEERKTEISKLIMAHAPWVWSFAERRLIPGVGELNGA
jgi:hypothetical protein